MHEIGLELKIESGKIIFSYRGKDYEIKSNPYEPCTYICQDGQIQHTLRHGFETSEIEKMILEDEQFKSISSRMIGQNTLIQIFAATIDDGRSVLTFDYAERLADKRRNKDHE